MSDGNYNRNLLPYRDYQSGFRAGRAQTLTRALETLRALLQRAPLDDTQRALILQDFGRAMGGL
ncbi:MAG: hypothetical protein J6M53_07075 [Bacteroidaceae bacterium]|nr:hypothetical protein [Bacteroidaceae bacterium]